MNRPFRVPKGKLIGVAAFALSVLLVYLYLPGSPSALNMIEWSIIGCWLVIGLVLYVWATLVYSRETIKIKMDQHITDKT
jgi:amino acid transporter